MAWTLLELQPRYNPAPRRPLVSKRWTFFSAPVVALLALVASPQAVRIAEAQDNGKIYVIDYAAGTSGRGALFEVNSSGERTVISDFGNISQGALGSDPFAIAFDGTRVIAVDQRAGTDCTGFGIGCGALFRVTPSTGARELVSDFGDATQGPTGLRLYGVAVDADGNYLVVDQDAGAGNAGVLFLVNPTDGSRTALSTFGDGTQGPVGGNPSGLGIDGTGQILVADAFPVPLLFGIDPDNGNRTVISDFTNGAQGPLGQAPINAEPGTFPNIWVLDQVTTGPAVGDGALFSAHALTGVRTLVSDFTNPAQGPIGFNVNDVRVYADGFLLVMDFDAGTNSLGGLFRVDPGTGNRTIFSDFGDATQGALGDEPSGIVYVPPPPPPPTSEVTLTVTKIGSGTGYVSSNPIGIDCGADCAQAYPLNQVVTLLAAPDAVSEFIGWSGDPDCSDGIVEMTTGMTCTAEFQRTVISRKQGFVGRDLKWFECMPSHKGPPRTCESGPWDPNPDSRRSRYIYDIFLPTLIPFIYNVQSSGVLPPLPQPVRVYAYLSQDNKLGPDDLRIGEEILTFPPGSSYARNSVCVAEDCAPLIPKLAPGKYYILAVIDPLNEIPELNENNNIERFEYWICSLSEAQKGNKCPAAP